MWIGALACCLLGAGCGYAVTDTGFRAVSVAYVVAAVLAAGLVRRGRPLRMLVACLPLAFAGGLVGASVADLYETNFPLTAKGLGETVGQQLVLHPGALWLGTALALLVGLRRGLARRGG